MSKRRFAGRRKASFYGALVALFALVASACAGSSPEGGGGGGSNEMVWAIGGSEANPGGVHRKVAALWSKENPDNPIRIERLPDEADQQRQQQSLELNSQSPLFDVLGVDVIWTGEYSQNGWLESLDDVRSQIEEDTIAPALESGEWGGELWAAPYNTNAGFLYYRTDLVKKPPQTWEELRRVGLQAAQQAGIEPFVGQGAQYEGFVVNYLEYYWSAGGELFNEDGTQVLFDDQKAMKALDFMRSSVEDGFYASGFNTFTEEEARNEFQTGKAVFMRQWPYAYSLMQTEKGSKVKNKFDIAPLPTFSGQGTISALGGFNNAVNAYSDQKEAAKEFVVWASTDPEVQKMLATEASLPPVKQSVYDELSNDPVMSLLGQVLPEAKPRPPAPTWNDISVEMQQQFFPAYNGEKDPQEAVNAVHDFLEESVQD